MKFNLRVAVLVQVLSLTMSHGASADATDGERVFRKCAACHSLEPGKNNVGPSLFGVVGRQCGAVKGYRYGTDYKAACNIGFQTNEAFLEEYLAGPSDKLGNILGRKARSKMPFKLKDTLEIENVIEFLKIQN
ncbi:c-type cytochrome [Thalassospira xiamenensis]|uniref:Cytochrome c n=1 Tax=Thalassospira xiamenensis TaxID=220697 RepID=A0A285U268_9PROT|nr:c-type cytochrome [Thalassospira xiamenensis]SOC31045.1 cytochrome c [Thalassospira xiamenensis]